MLTNIGMGFFFYQQGVNIKVSNSKTAVGF